MPKAFSLPGFWVFYEAKLVHPDKVKDIVWCCVVQHNMLRANRGAGGREMMRRHPLTLRMGIQVMGLTRTPITAPIKGTEGLPKGLVQRCWCRAMAGWEGVTGASSRVWFFSELPTSSALFRATNQPFSGLTIGPFQGHKYLQTKIKNK